MDTLTVRLYNVRFGDGILISVPDKDDNDQPLTRHILIDLGNVTSGEGGENEVFKPVLDDILNVLNGQPLDLYVLSHEHMDHVQGPLWAEKNAFPNATLKDLLHVEYAWLPISADENYYEEHDKAKKKLAEASGSYFAIQRYLGASGEMIPEPLNVLMRNNNRFLPAASDAGGRSHGRTADCVDYVRTLAGPRTHYVYRSVGAGDKLCDLAGKHPFKEAEFEIWAPEEDSSDYYGRFHPMALGAAADSTAPTGKLQQPTPPPGVDAGAFYNLVELRRSGYIDNLLAIDKAANNSSIVFCLKWRGWKLLFPGDAEIRSWKEMNKEEVLSPIHFLKVSHHGSHNGTPDDQLLHKLFPAAPEDNKPRRAAVSTYLDTYSGIPHQETFEKLETDFDCVVLSTLKDIPENELALKIEFEG